MEKRSLETVEFHLHYNTFGQSETILVSLFGKMPDIPPLELHSFGLHRYLL